MDVYMTEEEQIEAIKRFWKRYGNLILSIILAIILATTGWRWWQNRVTTISEQASQIYTQMLVKHSSADKVGVEVMAKLLLEDYSKTPYAAHAALILAQENVVADKLDQATQHLEWVEQNAADKSLQQIAMLRHARILLAKKQYPAALSLLDSIKEETFKPIINSLRGDIFQQQQQFDKARAAYLEAMTALPDDQTAKAIIQLKLDNLAAKTLIQNSGAAA